MRPAHRSASPPRISFRIHDQRQCRLHEFALAGLLAPQNLFWRLAGNATQTVFDGGALLHQLQESKDNYNAVAWSYRGDRDRRRAKRGRRAARAAKRCRRAQSGAGLRTRGQDQLRSRAPADAERQRQRADPADGADRPICKRLFKSCRRDRPGSPTPLPCSQRSGAVGGIARHRLQRRRSMSAPAKPSRLLTGTRVFLRYFSRRRRISAPAAVVGKTSQRHLRSPRRRWSRMS